MGGPLLLQRFVWCTFVLAMSWPACLHLVPLRCSRHLSSQMLFVYSSRRSRCWLVVPCSPYIPPVLLGCLLSPAAI